MQSELRSVVELVCTKLPSELQSTCTPFVEANYQKMLDLLMLQEPSAICTQVSYCGDSPVASPSAASASRPALRSLVDDFSKQKKLGADECSICKTFFTAFVSYVTDPSFINSMIHDVQTKVCPNVAKEFPECKDFVARYFPLIFSLLQQVSGSAVCGFAGLCPKTSLTEQIALFVQPRAAVAAAVQDDCSDCQAFITDLQKRYADPNAQQQLADTIANKACPALGTIFPQCASYAEEYVPIGLQMFEGLSPAAACQGIGWCSSAAARPAAALFQTFIKLVSAHARDATSTRASASASTSAPPTNDDCSDCETFVTDAQKRYSDPAQQQIVIDLVANQACPLLSSVFPQCAAYAKEYIPIGFQYLAGFQPQQVCQEISFCPSVSAKERTPLVLPWQKVAAAAPRVGDSCNDCEQFIGEAQHFYADPKNQQQIVDLATNALCPLISSVFPECVQFAQNEIPAFFNVFEQQDPSTICYYVGLCNGFRGFRPARTSRLHHGSFGSPNVRRFEMKPAAPSSKSNDQVCDDCQTFFTDLQKYYSDPNNVQNVINELVNEVCPLVSQDFPECGQLLPQYLPMVFQEFESLSPSTICTQLNFCTSSAFGTLGNMVARGLFRMLVTRMTDAAPSSVLCTDCNVVVEVLRGVLQSNATINELVATVVPSVCSIAAQAGRPMCTAMLGAALRELIYTFQHATDSQVCSTFFAQCVNTPSPARIDSKPTRS
jgi:hypothetical protein